MKPWMFDITISYTSHYVNYDMTIMYKNITDKINTVI